MCAPVSVPFIDFKTRGGWSKKRTGRADWVGYRRGQGLAPMESEGRMDEFTICFEEQNDEDVKDKEGGRGGEKKEHSDSVYRPRYKPAPDHVGIAQRAKEMEALRSDRVQRRREMEAQSQWRAARGHPTLVGCAS